MLLNEGALAEQFIRRGPSASSIKEWYSALFEQYFNNLYAYLIFLGIILFMVAANYFL